MNLGRGGTPSPEHAAMYHAPARWHDRKKARSDTGPNIISLVSLTDNVLGSPRRMPQTSGLKDGALVRSSAGPHGIQNSQPQVGKRPHRDRMTFPLLAFALMVVQRPRFTPGRLPGKQIERIPQRLQTGRAPMGFLVVPTLIEHWGRTCQRLQAARIRVARSVLDQVSQQPASVGPHGADWRRGHYPDASKKGR